MFNGAADMFRLLGTKLKVVVSSVNRGSTGEMLESMREDSYWATKSLRCCCHKAFLESRNMYCLTRSLKHAVQNKTAPEKTCSVRASQVL